MIIPVPVQTLLDPAGHFAWRPDVPATIAYNCAAAQAVAQHLQAALALHCQLGSSVQQAGPAPSTVDLCIADTVPELEGVPLRAEGYTLSVSEAGIVVCAEAGAGLFYGVQSLLQLLPWSSAAPSPSALQLQALRVVDYPRFEYRGTLLDVGRHVFSVPFIKKFLDALALHKVNRFHWHLTEDQGWRIEIKALPRLTDHGAWRGPAGARYGGFYTHDDVRAVVAYAAERFIQVIPEIELPGHCKAALACYPSLSCTGVEHPVPTQWGIQADVYCAGKEETFAFLETVLTEVVALFPGEYVHIGGDECPKARWAECPLCQARIRREGLRGEHELQTWFIQRVARWLAARGRRIIGWDEILEGGIPENAVVMSWRGTSGGVIAARQRHRVIMCPNNRCYFDYRQSTNIQEPGTWYAVLPLEWAYMLDPYCRPVPPPAIEAAKPEAGTLPEEGPSYDASTATAVSASMSEKTEAEDASPRTSVEDSGAALARSRLSSARMETDTCSPPSSGGAGAAGGAEAAVDSGPAAAVNSVPVAAADSALDDSALDDEDACDLARCVDGVSGQMADLLMPADEAYIIGGQANLWTEFIPDEATAEYMLLPRLCAFAECVWSPPEKRNWRDFTSRTSLMLSRLHLAGYNYRPLSAQQ